MGIVVRVLCGRSTMLAVLVSSCIAGAAPAQNAAVNLKPGDDVQKAVQAAPAGTQFLLASGIYRMQSVMPKDNDVFMGSSGTVFDGAMLLTLQPDGRYWSAAAPAIQWQARGCDKTHPLCYLPNDLFLDNHPQQRVGSLEELTQGNWFYDTAAEKVYISQDPAGHMIEYSTSNAAFAGKAKGVTLQNFAVEKYAMPAQRGAIGAYDFVKNWRITGVEARLNHGTGIVVGSGSVVEQCRVHNNGQKGIGAANAENTQILNNEIAFNNYAGYEPGFEAGGTKFSGTTDLVVRGNNVHDNRGPGLWTDIDNRNTLYEDNVVTNNLGAGILHEISYDATIRNNTVSGIEGITVVLSPNVQVTGNNVTLAANGNYAIRIATGRRGEHVAGNDTVQGNTITYLGPLGRSGISGNDFAGLNIHFDGNIYRIRGGGDRHWLWSQAITLDEARRLGLETSGSVTH